jgi:hypothetical protein
MKSYDTQTWSLHADHLQSSLASALFYLLFLALFCGLDQNHLLSEEFSTIKAL